jgi:hypothetical protein
MPKGVYKLEKCAAYIQIRVNIANLYAGVLVYMLALLNPWVGILLGK